MVAKEFCFVQEAGNEENNTLLHDAYEGDEEEETLSLCDLPINSSDSISSIQWVDFSKEDGGLNNDDDDDFFEFFSEEFTTSTTTHPTAENIVFCGKLIPFKDHPHATDHKNIESNISKTKQTSVGKVSLMRSTTTTRSRWFLFMFGMSRLSNTEMELKDIRNRQSRTRRISSAAMFPAPENGEKVKVNGGRRGGYKGVWRMLKSISVGLGCSSSRIANDVVKAAFV